MERKEYVLTIFNELTAVHVAPEDAQYAGYLAWAIKEFDHAVFGGESTPLRYMVGHFSAPRGTACHIGNKAKAYIIHPTGLKARLEKFRQTQVLTVEYLANQRNPAIPLTHELICGIAVHQVRHRLQIINGPLQGMWRQDAPCQSGLIGECQKLVGRSSKLLRPEFDAQVVERYALHHLAGVSESPITTIREFVDLVTMEPQL